MSKARGGASAPPRPSPTRLRDTRGRFVAPGADTLLEALLRHGIVTYPDPFSEGMFTLESGVSMKKFPVRLFHSEFSGRAWHACSGEFDDYGSISPHGYQLAISPTSFYGWPGDKWEGKWTLEGMATLLLHLSLSVPLRRLDCGDTVGSRKRDRV